MKRLNRKGFTLVELLAVIVILAIVMGITLVTVLPTLQKSRQQAFELTAQTASDFLEKEYQLYMVGETSTIDSALMSSFQTGTTTQTSTVLFTGTTLKLAGLKPENYVYGSWYINKTSGRACVILYASTNTTVSNGVYNLALVKEAGEYYDATELSAALSLSVYTSASAKTNKSVKYSVAKSSFCS